MRDHTASPAKDYYYHTDDLYNVMAATDDAGAVVERYEYDDYGLPYVLGTDNNFDNPIGATTIENNILFTGRYYDTETGLYYYRTRYMDPKLGRFTTRDTLGLWGDAPNLGNGVTYVGGSPLTWVDPIGDKRRKTGGTGGQGVPKSKPHKNRGGKKKYRHKPSFYRGLEKVQEKVWKGLKWLEKKVMAPWNLGRCLQQCASNALDCYAKSARDASYCYMGIPPCHPLRDSLAKTCELQELADRLDCADEMTRCLANCAIDFGISAIPWPPFVPNPLEKVVPRF